MLLVCCQNNHAELLPVSCEFYSVTVKVVRRRRE